MTQFDTQPLVAATNFIHNAMLQAAAEEASGRNIEAFQHYISATAVACQMMDLIEPEIGKWEDIILHGKDDKLMQEVFDNPDSVIKFLEAEEDLLRKAGLQHDFVTLLMDRCIEFVEQKRVMDDWPGRMKSAFQTAKYDVCEEPQKELHWKVNKYRARRIGLLALKASAGFTIIAINVLYSELEDYRQSSVEWGLAFLGH